MLKIYSETKNTKGGVHSIAGDYVARFSLNTPIKDFSNRAAYKLVAKWIKDENV